MGGVGHYLEILLVLALNEGAGTQNVATPLE